MNKPLLLVAVVLLAGCQYDPFAHQFTSRRPADDSLAGRYVLDGESKVVVWAAQAIAAVQRRGAA